MSEIEMFMLGFGLVTAVFTLGILLHVRKEKEKMRHSMLRHERIKEKLED